MLIAETDDGKELPVGPGRFRVTARGGKGHALKRKTKIVRVTPVEPLAPPRAAGAAELRWTWRAPPTRPTTSPSSRASSRSAAAPACTSAAPTRKGYHHLLWEIVDNSVDEVINGYATRIEVTLHKDGKSATVERQRPRHPGRHQEGVQEVGARAGADDAARGRQVLRRRSTSSRAACTASARRSSTRCPRS